MAGDGGVLSLATRGRIRTPPKPCLGDLSQGLAVAVGSFPLAPGGPGSDARGKTPQNVPAPGPCPATIFPLRKPWIFFRTKFLRLHETKNPPPPLLMIRRGGRG
ncbi:hypothetical protein KIL84_008691 [Mauremys mutica]|uniref:Uncharacterized protein n=1 Tax=Mauremys mutica TaxID=74926 RepID=A0A9D3X8L5_9SAUR|nr:hypothetical protein KIL84_008691 [Mauremys mutica]